MPTSVRAATGDPGRARCAVPAAYGASRVHFDAFPIWLSEQEGFSERGRPTVFCRRGLVVHGNPSAVQAGISAGMSLQGALQQAAELQQVPGDRGGLGS